MWSSPLVTSRTIRWLTCTILLASLSLRVCHGENPNEPQQKPALGELEIKGELIQHLVLMNERGDRETFDHPGERVSLPAGDYRLWEVRLTNGYRCQGLGRYGDGIKVTLDTPAVLKVGGPLKHNVRVTRRGGLLELDYELLGIGSEIYAIEVRETPPQFSVFQNDKQIESGQFEYG